MTRTEELEAYLKTRLEPAKLDVWVKKLAKRPEPDDVLFAGLEQAFTLHEQPTPKQVMQCVRAQFMLYREAEARKAEVLAQARLEQPRRPGGASPKLERALAWALETLSATEHGRAYLNGLTLYQEGQETCRFEPLTRPMPETLGRLLASAACNASNDAGSTQSEREAETAHLRAIVEQAQDKIPAGRERADTGTVVPKS